MAAITNTGNRTCHFTLSTTVAQTWALNRKVKSVRVTNKDTDDLYVTIITSTTQITDDAGITTAVALADESYIVPGGLTSGNYQSREIWRSSRPAYVAGSVVGNGGGVSIEGFDFY